MIDLVPRKYKNDTRLGNWYEEKVLDEDKMKDYLQQKETKSLLCFKGNKFQGVQRASVTYNEDGLIRFNDRVRLKNSKTKGFLACDLGDKLPINDDAFAVTSNPDIGKLVRSVFVLKRFENDQYADDVIHYGQKFQIMVNPRYSEDKPLYMFSCPIAPLRFAKFSRKQEASVVPKGDFYTVWVFEYSDPKVRFQYVGKPVKVGDPVLIKHCFTSHWMANDFIDYMNDYGKELEVFVHSFQYHNKTQNLIGEKSGRTTIDVTMRNQYEENEWRVVGGDGPSDQFDEFVKKERDDPEEIFREIKEIVVKKGEYGLRGLSQIFRDMDLDGSNCLNFDEFQTGLKTYGIFLPEQELKSLFVFIDRDRSGVISYPEFLRFFKGNISEFRLILIRRAFEKVDPKKLGEVSLEDLAKAYKSIKHPAVAKKFKTDKEVLREFIQSWDKKFTKSSITHDDFLDFYSDVSANILRDDLFEILMLNSWGLEKIKKFY